ncbi:MAG: hypothetical protein QME40_02885 [bacterium]|nr:hypothetical protein [bacterium]
MLICCERCSHYHQCMRKWVFSEKGIEPACCVECSNFKACLDENRKERWRFIHME